MEEKYYKLKSIVEELESYKGKHTEFISVYIPADYSIHSITDQLKYERTMAENIKTKSTRENVLAAIDMILRELKFYKKTPENGMAIFCGNISKKEGKQEMKIIAIVPPNPLTIKMYHCNHTFFLQPLKEMLEEKKDFYGIIVIDKKEATFGMLEGKIIKKLMHLTSGIPGKIRAGGQSSVRFERLREGATKEFYKRVAENAKKFFFDKKIKGILLGGPGITKEEFLKEGDLATAIKEKIIAIKDIGYADEHGLKVVVEECREILVKTEIMEEKNKLKQLFENLAKENAVVGLEKVKKALSYGSASTVIVVRGVEKEIKEFEEIEKMASESGCEIFYVSEETEEGTQLKNLGGIGAVLRFKIKE